MYKYFIDQSQLTMHNPSKFHSIFFLLIMTLLLVSCNSGNEKSEWVKENHSVIYSSLRNHFPESYNKQAEAFYDYLHIVNNPEFDNFKIIEDCKKYFILYRKDTSLDFNDPGQLMQVRQVNGGAITWVALIRDKEFLLQFKK